MKINLHVAKPSKLLQGIKHAIKKEEFLIKQVNSFLKSRVMSFTSCTGYLTMAVKFKLFMDFFHPMYNNKAL